MGGPFFMKKKNNKQCITYFPQFTRQSGVQFFFNLKLIFILKYLEITAINLSITTKNPINISKNQNQSKAIMIPTVRQGEKKQLGQTTFMKWNLLTPK
jgi:hypothetical protein